MTEDELRRIVENMLIRSEWWDSAAVQDNMAQALDAYLGRKQRASIPGKLDYRSEDVADMVEAVTAQIMPAFHFDELAMFEGNGRNDIDQARLESKICNQFIFDFNEGDIEIQTAVKDLLLLRNGILKVYLEEQIDTRQERYTGLTDIELQGVQQKTAHNQEIDITHIEFDKEARTTDVTLTRITHYRRLNVEAIDPVDFIIEREYRQVNPSNASIAGERRFETRSDLVAQGFDREQVDKLVMKQTDTRQATLARNRTQNAPLHGNGDSSQDFIECFELYLKVDFDGDGIAERRRILYCGGVSGGVILENEPHPFVPYAVGVPFLYPHRFQGISLFDKLRELENQKSRALTQYANNLANAAFPELVVADGEVAEADYTTRRSGGIIRADTVNSVKPIPVPDVGTASIGFLNYLDKVRAERGGASLDLQSAQGQISDSAHATERQFSTREQLASMICSTIGDTLVKQLFRLVHQNLREYFPGEQDFHVGASQFVTADTANWPARMKVRVTAGMSFSERQQKRAVLESHLLQSEKLWAAGFDNVLVSFDTYAATLRDWSKAGGLQSPGRYWVDPNSDEAQAALQQKSQAAEADQKRQAELQDDLLQLQLLIGDRDNRTDLVKHLTELRFKYWDGVLTSEVEEMRVQAQGSDVADPDPELIDADQDEGRTRSEEVG